MLDVPVFNDASVNGVFGPLAAAAAMSDEAAATAELEWVASEWNTIEPRDPQARYYISRFNEERSQGELTYSTRQFQNMT